MHWVIVVLTFLVAAPALALENCRQALVLALDVSGSVNQREFDQQITGLANALNAPDVRQTILDGAHAPVALAVFEWSSQNHQFLIQPWISLRDETALDTAIARIRAHRKVRAGLKTATGTALGFASALLEDQSHCWLRTIDVSGDGRHNIGPSPDQVYRVLPFGRVTVNALVVGDPRTGQEGHSAVGITKAELLHYFETEVIHGADAFAMIADGYEDYARAMRRKLLRELALPMFGGRMDPRAFAALR